MTSQVLKNHKTQLTMEGPRNLWRIFGFGLEKPLPFSAWYNFTPKPETRTGE